MNDACATEWGAEEWTCEILGGNLYRIKQGNLLSFLDSHQGSAQWLIGNLVWICPQYMESLRGTHVNFL